MVTLDKIRLTGLLRKKPRLGGAFLCASVLERVETAAQEREDRVDRCRKISGALRFRLRAFVSLAQRVEGGGEGRGNDLRARVVRGRIEIFGDLRGDHLLELGDPGSQVTAEQLVV